jgi:hypothetical protein
MTAIAGTQATAVQAPTATPASSHSKDDSMTARNSRNASNSKNESNNRSSNTEWTPTKAGTLAIAMESATERPLQQGHYFHTYGMTAAAMSRAAGPLE